ncbi:hypothetical protein AAC387_Pa01g2795 [Persea americana]
MVSMGFRLLAGKGLIGNGATIMGFAQVVAATFDQLTKQLQDLFAQMIALQEQPEAITTAVEKIERFGQDDMGDYHDANMNIEVQEQHPETSINTVVSEISSLDSVYQQVQQLKKETSTLKN